MHIVHIMTPPKTPPAPLELYALRLLRAVASHGSITRACAEVGLTQSALTRQIQGLEARLGVGLFDRTTRQLTPTKAGHFLLDETAGLSSQVESIVRRLREEFIDGPREVRIGLSHSVALAHLPGLIHAHVRRSPEVRTRVAHLGQAALLTAVVDGSLDLGVLCPPRRLPVTLAITHRMTDAFAVVAPAPLIIPAWTPGGREWPAHLILWLAKQPWLMLAPETTTGRMVKMWMDDRSLRPASVTQLDSFDLIVHLVALGLGVSVVPQRALAAFPRKNQLQRIALPEPFTRELVVVIRRSHAGLPRHVQAFVDSILFS
ncbi:MAG: LysR family transcriptional regulator [Verrucomicrobiales bacterium]